MIDIELGRVCLLFSCQKPKTKDNITFNLYNIELVRLESGKKKNWEHLEYVLGTVYENSSYWNFLWKSELCAAFCCIDLVFLYIWTELMVNKVNFRLLWDYSAAKL